MIHSETHASMMHQACMIRFVEEELLKLFSVGKLAGTTHTCIGQELSAVALAASLDRERDIIFSNHRCHGHYLAWTDDVEGLLAEVMGKRTGVCAGLGGSQHLCAPHFFSNGVQGGIVPVSAGLAFSQKLAGTGGIVAVCIGDGTLGEGVVYETFNLASKWELPLLFVLENNLYAQSTSQQETLAGDICARAAAFGIRTFQGSTWEYDSLARVVQRAADITRGQSKPCFVRVDTYRLAAHSKGDDDRDPDEVARYAKRDPVNTFLRQAARHRDKRLALICERVEAAVETAEQEEPLHTQMVGSDTPATRTEAVSELEPGTQLEAINASLLAWMQEDPRVILLGEDIRSPYGGAFKATRGLSDAFPARVLNMPISEAAIVGMGNGLALGGYRPVVEIMFGDFLTLAFDQIVNHAAKFVGMYHRQVTNPVVIRAPMGGGRGYGPTHSQNLEKHFAGIPGLTLLVLHGRTRIARMYQLLRETQEPVLLIENKLLYRERCGAPLPPGTALHEYGSPFPATIIRPEAPADLTLVAFGRMSVLAERVAARLSSEEEILVELILPLQVSPLNASAVVESISRTGRLLVVEEGASGFDLASELIARVSLEHRCEKRLHLRRLAAQPVPIPSAPGLESKVLPGESEIFNACVELFDA